MTCHAEMRGKFIHMNRYDLTFSATDFYRPLYPEARDQGDPYVLTLPPSAGARFRFYTYVTGEEQSSGRAFPVYGSNDLIHWESLGGTLVADLTRAYWAPCVQYIPTLEYPYVMLYSRGAGLEEIVRDDVRSERAHIGHRIRRAHSRAPEGPFVDSGHILTPDLDFAIDPDVYRAPDGRLKLAFAMDLVEDEPLGTGIVEANLSEDLTQITSAIRVLARAKYDWQIYDRARRMPWKSIPNVNWEIDTVCWHTLEAPVGGLVSPQGRPVYLYSGGCFFGFYGVGALVEQEGELVDISAEGQLVVAPAPERGFIAPGHCSLVRDIRPTLPAAPETRGEMNLIMLHARFGSLDAPRQMCLVPLVWSPDGRPVRLPASF